MDGGRSEPPSSARCALVSTTGDGGGWVVLPPGEVPEDWRARARHVALVPLLPEEIADVLQGRPAVPALEKRDERIARMLAGGSSLREIGRAVGLSPRGVQHRLARLRDRYGVGSNAELAAYLARHGMGMDQTRNDSPQETTRGATKD